MIRGEAVRLARAVSRECYRRWRVSENWEAVDIDSIVDEFLAEPPAPDVQALRGQIESEVWEARKRVEAALSAEIVELRAQIDAARAEEREACAQLCEEVAFNRDEGSNGGARNCAWEIRARSGARGV